MKEYVTVIKYGNNVGVSFAVENQPVLAIGEKLYELCPDAYMNGYNWDALLRFYLEQNAPELLEGLETDPEAGSYAAYYPLSEENEAKAEKFVALIRSLIEHEEDLYRLVREHGAEIEWD